MPPVPRLPGKTKQLYQSLSVNHFTDGQITRRLVEAIKKGEPFSPSYLFNTFENVAFSKFEGLGTAREHFIKLGADNVHLAGSGPALYTLTPEKSRAEEIYLLLQGQRMTPFLAETVPAFDVT
jgi:4-diphosphocytidyl-2-C-methyl-D-erythritol kinase